jgi:plastocyanin
VIVALAVTGAAALGAGQALGASEPITTSTACCSYGKASFTIDQGTVATFQNRDPGAAPHDVTAVASGAGGNPLFRSATINLGQTPVNGTESLAPGTYRFFCAVHPTQMSGELVVAGSGSSGVEVKILSRNLDGVVSSHKLKVKLHAVTAFNDVALTARKGKRTLGSKRGIDLPAGATRTVGMSLSRAGRNSLENLGSAKVKVTATVPGSAPASATRRLR